MIEAMDRCCESGEGYDNPDDYEDSAGALLLEELNLEMLCGEEYSVSMSPREDGHYIKISDDFCMDFISDCSAESLAHFCRQYLGAYQSSAHYKESLRDEGLL